MAAPNSNAPVHYDDYEDDRGSGSFTDQLDLQHYLRILRKHKLPITLFTAAVTALAAYYAYTATPEYSSTSTLLIESQGTNVPSIEELVTGDTESQDYYQTQFEILRSRALAARVVNHMGLWNHPELSPQAREDQARVAAAQRQVLGEEVEAPAGVDGLLSKVTSLFSGAKDNGFESTTVVEEGDSAAFVASSDKVDVTSDLTTDQQSVINAFMGRLTITPVRKTKLVKVSYLSADPVFAANVANTVGDQYIESYLDAKLERTSTAATFLNERLRELRGTLDESKGRLIAFKETNGLVDVDGSVGRLNEQQLLLATAELAQARSELAQQRSIYNEVQSLRGRTDLLESIPAIQADPLVQRTKIDQGSAQRQLDELLNRYGERHPRVVDAKSQVATLSASLEGHVNRVIGTIANDFQLAQSSVSSIEAKLNVGKQEIQAIGSKKFELDELQNEVDTNQSIYDAFYNQITQAKSADGLESANARISDFAVASNNPVKPKKQLIIALAALASLILSMLMAFLYEQMDDTIKSTSDVEDKLGERLLGILPLVKGGVINQKDDRPVNPAYLASAALELTGKKKESIHKFFESVDTARTAICLADGDEFRKVIMVTSSKPGEGKSTTSLNLAYSLAKIERVLLIDCDLRKPTVAKTVITDDNVRANHVGLSELIAGTAAAKQCIIRGAFDQTLDVLPSGQLPERPLELISSLKFKKIIESLSKHYDRIILDCAPIQAVSDAQVLSRYTDAVVYCVEAQETPAEMVKRGLQRLRQVDAKIAGILVTQVDMEKIVSYGGDYYYQGMYDYYGYNEKGDRKGKGRGKLKLSQATLQDIQQDDSDVDLGLGDPSDLPNRAAINDHEFDMTTQVNVAGGDSRMGGGVISSKPLPKPAPIKSVKKPGRMQDDLDFL